MNLADRIYLAVHLALTVLVCVRHPQVAHWPWYVAWNVDGDGDDSLASRASDTRSSVWEFAHDWLPAIFFITVFEEVSFLSLALLRCVAKSTSHRRGSRRCSQFCRPSGCIAIRRPGSPSCWTSATSPFTCFIPPSPEYCGPGVAALDFAGAFRRLTDALSVGYAVCYATYLLFPTRSPSHNVGLSIAAATGSQTDGPIPLPGELDPGQRRSPRQRISQLAHHAGFRRAGVRVPLFPASRSLAAAVQPPDVCRALCTTATTTPSMSLAGGAAGNGGGSDLHAHDRLQLRTGSSKLAPDFMSHLSLPTPQKKTLPSGRGS